MNELNFDKQDIYFVSDGLSALRELKRVAKEQRGNGGLLGDAAEPYYKLLVLDYYMPGMNGLDVIKKARNYYHTKSLQFPKVVLYTAI